MIFLNKKYTIIEIRIQVYYIEENIMPFKRGINYFTKGCQYNLRSKRH